MKENHIIELIESVPLANLTNEQLVMVRAHSEACESCSRAYEAARLSTLAIKERVAVDFEPSPFFQTRVMAALREQQARESVPAIVRLWKSARVLVSSMAVTTAALAALSFVVPANTASSNEETAALSAYSAEGVILGSSSDDQLTYEQVLSTIYSEEDEAK